MSTLREVDVARPIIPWLEERGWDVYQEVSDYDIVAVTGHIVWIVEVKTSLSTKLCAQAFDRCRYAHYVSVAVPATERRDDGHNWAESRLAERGIGVFTVNLRGGVWVRAESMPALHRKPLYTKRLLASLRPEHKTHCEAGTPGGGGWTPWKGTCKSIVRKVAEHPGITLKELLGGEEGHYHYANAQSARTSLSHWLRLGKIPGIECRHDGRHLRLYALEAS